MKTLSSILVDKPVGRSILDYAIRINPEIDGQLKFNFIRENLRRIGLVSTKDSKRLSQTVHVYYDNETKSYYLMHFTMMFALDNGVLKTKLIDLQRLEYIAKNLVTWGLCSIVNPEVMDTNYGENFNSGLKFIRYKDINNWVLHPIYRMKKTVADFK